MLEVGGYCIFKLWNKYSKKKKKKRKENFWVALPHYRGEITEPVYEWIT